MKRVYDLAIIGAGPTGLAAAVAADRSGLSTLLIDEQRSPGGQIYRNIEDADTHGSTMLGKDYLCGKPMAEAFRQSGATYLCGATVWNVDRKHTITYSLNHKSSQVTGRTILIATGAMERPVPLPGWQLCNVMGAGAADVLLKTADIVPDGDVVLCGSGPLLLLVASHLINRGVCISAFLDTTPLSNYLASLRRLPEALKVPRYLFRGVGMHLDMLFSRVPRYLDVKDIEIMGRQQVEGVRFTHRGKPAWVAADVLLLHNGVVPNIQLTRLMGCRHVWEDCQRYWHPETDRWGKTSVEGVYAAGDTLTVAGAKISEIRGKIVALTAAHHLGGMSLRDRDRRAQPLFRQLSREMAVRPFIDRLFQPAPSLMVPQDDATMICRCEEITVGDIRRIVRQGYTDPNIIKAITRCGMGPCQGRMCGLSLAEVIGDELGKSPADVGYYHIRPPLKPVFLQEMAEIELLV